MDPKTVTLCDGVYCWDCEVNEARHMNLNGPLGPAS